MKMTYEEATREAERMFENAKEASKRYNTEEDACHWAFVSGCLLAEIKQLLVEKG